MAKKYDVYVYHHTHWDREWWTTMQDFRIRLVQLIDDLLDVLDHDPTFKCFLLDGQTIVLKDYLEIRPENQEKLISYITNNRIQCGPWYILPDEFLVSGESHIRNLWLGKRLSEKLGFQNLSVGYIPDTFGHISQMPQLLKGFGIDNALVWRGTGGEANDFKQEFLWEAPNGEQVLTYWFPDGYYVVDFLHFENPEKTYDETFGRVQRSLERWAERATTDCLLMPYGGDHRLIDKRLPRLLDKVNEEFDHYNFIWASTKDYMDAIKRKQPKLEVIKGELREFGEKLPHVLPGVLSSRLYLKQRNAEGQLWLERYAEPFSTLAWRLGKKYESQLLWTAWELLIQNHPHDSICGCSIDQVHREMLPRFDQSKQIAEILSEKSLQYVNDQINTSDLKEGERALVVHNPLTWDRTDLVTVLIPKDERVSQRHYILKDCEGNDIPFQCHTVGTSRPMTDRYWYTEIKFLAANVPSLGFRTYTLSERETPLDSKLKYFTAIQETAALKGSDARTDLKIGNGVMENKYLKVEVNQLDGTLNVTDKESGETYYGLNTYEDGGDAGDEYAYSQPLNDLILKTTDSKGRVHVSIHEAGHATATLRVDLDWQLPASLTDDRLSRHSDYESTRISTFVTLNAESKRVAIRTEWENKAEDHRLRALFPLGERVEVSHAEGHFDVVERRVFPKEKGNGWPEPYVPTMPQQGYVSLAGQRKGLTVINKGLPEFEILQDDSGTIALTLLRAVGWVSREDTLVRVGGAGPETPVPDAQSLGKNCVEYAIVPHLGDDQQAKVYSQAHDYLTPLYGSSTGHHDGHLEKDYRFFEMKGNHAFLLSACKKAEKKEAMILRFWNTSKAETEAKLTFFDCPSRIYRVDLKEEELSEPITTLEDGRFLLKAKGAEIVSLAIEF